MKNHIKSNADNNAKKTIKKVCLFMSLLFFPLSLFSLQSTEIADNTIPLRYQPTNFNIIPKAPGAAELGNFISQGLNEATGSPMISIPIYTLETDQVSVPINISYNATGIKPEEISTEVGLKWSLQAGGSVSRVIKGLPDDDYNNGWLYYSGNSFPDLSWNQDFACHQDQFKNIANNYVDIIPDEFSYNFPGHNGTFIFNRNKNIYKEINDNVIIKPIWDEEAKIIGFEITDESGNNYKFGGNSYTSTTKVENFPIGGNSVKNEARSGNGINEWKLNSIITKNGKSINFTYENYSFLYDLVNSQTKHINLINTNGTTPSIQTTTFNNSFDLSLLLPKTIQSENTLIIFSYEDYDGAENWTRSLKGIEIRSNVPELIKKYSLDYDLYSGNNKLRLRKLNEVSTNSGESQMKTWGFNYKDDVLPLMSTCDVDFFGYYNAAVNSDFIVINHTTSGYFIKENSRNINPKRVANGILNEIIYPTGGKIKYYYEANYDIISGVDSIFAPGVRVSKTEEYDNKSSSAIVKNYKYTGLTGNTHLQNNLAFYRKIFINSNPTEIIFYSNERENIFPKNGYCYSKIETQYIKNNIVEFKHIDTYLPNEKNNKLHPLLIESSDYDNSSLKKQRILNTYTSQTSLAVINLWLYNSDVAKGDDLKCGQLSLSGGEYYYNLNNGLKFISYPPALLSSARTVYRSNSDSLINNTDYQYYTNYLTKNKTTWTSETNKDIFEEYEYPNSTNYDNLYKKNILNVPLIITTYKKDKNAGSVVIDKKKYDYDNNANILFYSDFVNNSASNYLCQKNEISYDSQFNIKEIKDLSSGLNTIYIWSYKGYPIAEIKNASYTEVATAVQTVFSISIDDLSAMTVPDEGKLKDGSLQSALTNALVTTYTYKPLVGIQSVTDPRGVTTRYIYDDFNRLQSIVNTNNQTTQSFDYNYKH